MTLVRQIVAIPDAPQSKTKSPLPRTVARLIGCATSPSREDLEFVPTEDVYSALPDVLIDCCHGRPRATRGTAVHRWHIDSARIKNDSDAALLANLKFAPIILRGIGMDDREHIVATRTLTVEATAISDQSEVVMAALPDLCLSILNGIACGCSMPRPDLDLVATIARVHESSRRWRLLQSAKLIARCVNKAWA